MCSMVSRRSDASGTHGRRMMRVTRLDRNDAYLLSSLYKTRLHLFSNQSLSEKKWTINACVFSLKILTLYRSCVAQNAHDGLVRPGADVICASEHCYLFSSLVHRSLSRHAGVNLGTNTLSIDARQLTTDTRAFHQAHPYRRCFQESHYVVLLL
jgi:hypothetical protein